MRTTFQTHIAGAGEIRGAAEPTAGRDVARCVSARSTRRWRQLSSYRRATHFSKVRPIKIGNIGAGNIGGALAHLFVDTGHEVTIANSRGPESLTDLANETGAHAGTVEEAVAGSEVVVVTIPQNKIPELPAELFADAPRV